MPDRSAIASETIGYATRASRAGDGRAGSALRGKLRLQESIARQVADRPSSKPLNRCLATQLRKKLGLALDLVSILLQNDANQLTACPNSGFQKELLQGGFHRAFRDSDARGYLLVRQSFEHPG